MQKKKLKLNKKVITTLSNNEMGKIRGGVYTTSNSDCTHFLCCQTQCGCEYTENREDTLCDFPTNNPSLCQNCVPTIQEC